MDKEKFKVLGVEINSNEFTSLLNYIEKSSSEVFKKIGTDFRKSISSACSDVAKEMTKTVETNLNDEMIELNLSLQEACASIFEVFQQPLNNAIQESIDIINGLTQNISIGDLGESLKNAADGLNGFVIAAAKLVSDDLLPVAVDGVSWLAKNATELVEIAAPLTTSVIAFNTAMKGFTIWQAAVTAIQEYKVASEGATIAQIALNTAMEINPVGLAIAGITALTAGLTTFIATTSAVSTGTENYSRALERARESSDNIIASGDKEIAILQSKAGRYEELRQKYEDLTDGEMAEFLDLASDLAEVLPEGTNIIDEQTGAYNSLESAIDGVIKKMETQALLNAKYTEYEAAILNKYDIEKKLKLAEQEWLVSADGLAMINESGGWRNLASAMYYDTSDDAAKKAFIHEYFREEYGIDYNELEEILAENQEVIDEYNKLYRQQYESLNGPGAGEYVTKMKENAFEQINKWSEPVKNILRAFKIIPAQTWSELQSSLSDLDDKLAIHNIDDTEYWDERLRLLQASQYRENKEWWAYYDKTIEHYNNLSEAEKKAHENDIKAKADALKEMKETDESGYYDRLEALISTLDKGSDLYKQYNSEIIKGRKALADKIINEDKETQKAQIASAAQTVKEVQAEYSQMLSDVLTEQESYKNKLMGIAKLYTDETKTDDNGNETRTFTLENIDKQIKAVEAYDNKLKALEKRGMGKGLSSYLGGLSQEDSENVMHVLSDMSDEELKAYSDKYDKLMETINERAEDRYAPQVEAINDGFIKKVNELMEQLPGKMQELGVDSINSFVHGFTGNRSELIKALSEELDGVLDSFSESMTVETTDQDVKISSVNDSPSSAESVSDFINMMNNIKSGSSPNVSFIEGFARDFEEELNGTYERVMAERSLAVEGMTAGQQMASFNYYANVPQTSSRRDEKIVLENHENITVKLDKEVVGKAVRQSTREYQRRTGT